MVILTRTNLNCGICSYIWTMFDMVCNEILHYKNEKFKIDFSGYFYPQLNTENSKINFWDDYLEQPIILNQDCGNQQTYKDFETIGWKILHTIPLDIKNNFFKKYIRFKNILIDNANRFYKNNNLNNSIGILARRTDYNSKFAKNHPIQPSNEQLKQDIDRLVEDYKYIDSIFIICETNESFEWFKQEYSNKKVIKYQTISLNMNDNQNCSLFLKNMDYEYKKQLNFQYLTSLLIMSKLNFILAGNTSASSILQYIVDKPTYFKIYNLGRY